MTGIFQYFYSQHHESFNKKFIMLIIFFSLRSSSNLKFVYKNKSIKFWVTCQVTKTWIIVFIVYSVGWAKSEQIQNLDETENLTHQDHRNLVIRTLETSSTSSTNLVTARNILRGIHIQTENKPILCMYMYLQQCRCNN